MARSRGPQNLLARDRGRGVDARARDDYDGMLASDLGGRRINSYRAIDDGRPGGAADLLLRPLTLFLFACLMLSLMLLAWAWQTGLIGSLLPHRMHERPRPSPTAWMAGRPDHGTRPIDTRHTDVRDPADEEGAPDNPPDAPASGNQS